MSGKTTQNTENTSVQDAAASMLSTGNAVANQVQEGADQAQELKERIDSKVANTNETLSEGSAAVANALTFKSYTDGNTPLKAKKVDDEWVTTQEVANVTLRQGTFSKFIRDGDVTMTERAISAKDLGPVGYGDGEGNFQSGRGELQDSETIVNRYELGKGDDGNLNAALDKIDISDGTELLSKMVKLKSWLGVDDSTFLTFIKKVEEFNGLGSIDEKKVAYENLIKQGYAWLAAFPNLNNEKANKKRAIIHKLISGSFSNFGAVELRYMAFEDAYKSFTADSSIDILSPSGFNGIDAFVKLRAFLNEKDIWKKQHNSPVKNRMHSEEKEAMEKIENLGTLEVKSSGEFNIIPGVLKISNPTLKLENLGKKITITSGISLAEGLNFEAAQLNASGKFTILINDFKIENATTTLENGQVNGSFLNQNFRIEGVEYSSSEGDKISASSATWNGKILNKDSSITFNNPSISHAEGFMFTTAVGTLNEVNFGSFVKLQNIEILVLREGKDQYNITGTSNSSFEAGIPGLAEVNLTGNFTLNRNANKIFNSKIENGNLTGTILGQTLSLTNLNYDSIENENEISAETASFVLNVFGKEFLPIITGPKINEKGFDFKTATLPVNFNHSVGPLTITATELMVINNGAGDYDVKAEGGVDLKTGGKNFGIDGKILGGINYNLKTKKTTKYLKEAEAKADIKNPLSKYTFPGDLFPTAWPIEPRVSIPIAPGVSATFGFYVRGGVSLKENITIQLTATDTNLLITISSGIKGDISAGVTGGVEVGASTLASLAVELGVGATMKAEADAILSREFSDEKNDLNPKEDLAKGFIYTNTLDVMAAGFVRFTARAFVILKKSYKKELVEYHIGTYVFTNDPKQSGPPRVSDKSKSPVKDKEIGDEMGIEELGFDASKEKFEERFQRFKNGEEANSVSESGYETKEQAKTNSRIKNIKNFTTFLSGAINVEKNNKISEDELSTKSKRQKYRKQINNQFFLKETYTKHYSKLITEIENDDMIKIIPDSTDFYREHQEITEELVEYKKEAFDKSGVFRKYSFHMKNFKKTMDKYQNKDSNFSKLQDQFSEKVSDYRKKIFVDENEISL